MAAAPVSRLVLLVSLLLFALTQQACFLPPECVPDSEAFDEEACFQEVGLLALLLFGPPSQRPPAPNLCPSPLLCTPTNCFFAAENGHFHASEVDLAPWTGDLATPYATSCDPERPHSLRFVASTPSGDGFRASSQVYQIVDLNRLIPPASRPVLRRVRAQAATHLFIPPSRSEDVQEGFGLGIYAFAGNASAFPTGQDLEGTPRNTAEYELLGEVQTGHSFDVDGADWQPMYTQMMLPENTSFLVVFVEAIEISGNDLENEFPDFPLVDAVQILIDAGPYSPIAQADSATTRRNTPVQLPVLRNDHDPDALINPLSLRVIGQPQHGTADVNPDGTITYTPAVDYLGPDAFSYAITDRDGLTAGAPVAVEVLPENLPPVAVFDIFDVVTATPTVLDVLANDTDPDGDPLRVFAAGQPLNGTTELVEEGQAVLYTPNPGFLGEESFGYLITDGQGGFSNEVLVTVRVAPPNQAPVVSAPIHDIKLNVDPASTCTFDLNNHFSDPEGEPLQYNHFQSGSGASVLVSIDGATISLTGLVLGIADVTVIAEDPGGLTVRTSFFAEGGLVADCGGNASAP